MFETSLCNRLPNSSGSQLKAFWLNSYIKARMQSAQVILQLNVKNVNERKEIYISVYVDSNRPAKDHNRVAIFAFYYT